MRRLTDIENILQRDDLSRDDVHGIVADVTKHLEELRVRESRIFQCQERIQNILQRLDEQEARQRARAPANLQELIRMVDNPHQRDALDKLAARHESAQMYLSKYETNTSTDRKKQGIQGSFSILGTLRSGVRDEYEVRMYKPGANAKGTFWCSCPDHKFNSTKKKMVCKHVCFLVCRVGKLLDPNFFETKQLTQEQFDTFVQKAENSQQLLTDLSICRPSPSALFTQNSKELTPEDLCPICYDDMNIETVLSCPSCTNYVHKECMKVWLERKDTCVYCRSDIWRQYRC